MGKRPRTPDRGAAPVARACSLYNRSIEPTWTSDPGLDAGLLKKYQAILASTLDPIVIIDATGLVHVASDSVERVFGWTAEELIGRNINVLMPEPHHSRHDGYLSEYRRTGATNILGHTREFEGVRRDGSVFPIELAVSRVDVPDQEHPLFAGIIRDITARKRSELEIHLLKDLALAAAGADDLTAAMIMALERICGATGWDYGEAWMPDEDEAMLIDTPVWHARDPALHMFQEMTQGTRFAPGEGLPGRVWASREPEWLEDLEDIGDGSIFKRAEAASHAGLRTAVAVPITAPEGVVAIMAFFMRDKRAADARLLELVQAAVAPLGPAIQRRRAEEALAESERRYRDVLENVQLVAVMLAPDGRVSFCNDYLLDVTGWAREEVLGRDWFEAFIPEEQRAAVGEVFREAVRDGRLRPHFENEILTRAGGRRLISWNNTMLRDPTGTLVGVTGLGMDITDQRRAERELAHHRQHLEEMIEERTKELEASHAQLRLTDRLASIGTLAAGLGHDMNNVLLPIRCRLDALQSTDMTEKNRDHFESVRRSVDYLQQLTHGLHLLSLDPHEQTPVGETVDVRAWWEQVGKLLNTAAPRHVTLRCEMPDDLPSIAVPPHGLTQAMLNLIVNAGEAMTDPGEIRVWAEVDLGRDSVRLGVTDEGPGMEPEVRRRALDPFFSTKKRGLGTGLGLSLVHGVVQSAGGGVRIDSQPGQGTTVVLTFPIADQARTRPAGALEAAISVENRRLSTLLAAMLSAVGLASRPIDGDRPPDTDLWITTPSAAGFDAARTFLKTPGRQVVLVGEADDAWRDLTSITIDPAAEFDLIRERIGEAVSALTRDTT